MASLLVKVKAKMVIYSHEKVRTILDGEYGSVFKGRSMDFDDLRAYIPGDDVKDIDWKATARSGQTLIKRYIAVRKHNILLVVDTGKNMSAQSSGGQRKSSIAVMLAGVIGYLAQKHGDLVALVCGDSKHTFYLPLKGTNSHLEHMLQKIDGESRKSKNKSSIATQLEYIARNISRKMMLVIIIDEIIITEDMKRLLRRLRAQHEIMLVTVEDFGYLNDIGSITSVEKLHIPDYMYNHRQVKKAFLEALKTRSLERQSEMQRLGIVTDNVDSEEHVIETVYRLLERQKHARR